jgi:hypothetical protein
MQAMDSNGLTPELIDAKTAPNRPPAAQAEAVPTQPPVESGGPAGLEPTRYGDWERRGRCIDF